jgi:hypothetical protein
MEISTDPSQETREQEIRDESETGAATGKDVFLPAFRNLLPLLCVPKPE